MAFFGMRFDLRNPATAETTMTQRYREALSMAEWADRLGFVSLVLSEHHGSDDGYLPSPLVMAAAVAARTERIRIMVSALIAPLHDPVRLAEDVAVVDLISGGRLDLVLANGYVADEFAMFDVPMTERARRVRECIAAAPLGRNGRVVRARWAIGPSHARRRTAGGSAHLARGQHARRGTARSPTR